MPKETINEHGLLDVVGGVRQNKKTGKFSIYILIGEVDNAEEAVTLCNEAINIYLTHKEPAQVSTKIH